jgi:peptide-methionine (S)-S-oxide reductase
MSLQMENSPMFSKFGLGLIAILALAAVLTWNHADAASGALVLPDPIVDSAATAATPQSVVLSGGCFWGIQAVYQHLKGVSEAISGYSGGAASTAQYEIVSTGNTGHAESVKITFDARQVSFGQVLKVFFSVAHDPTQLNRQGPDFGSQYRSVIFYANDEQKHIAEAYIDQINRAKVFPRPIVTQIVPLKAFYAAEDYHQNYATLHPDDPYIAYNDLPKVDHLRQQFPALYKK